MPADYESAKGAQFISLFNGIMALAAAGVREGWFKAQDIDFMHRMMTKPIDLPEHANHEGLEGYRQLIEGLLVEMKKDVRDRN